MKSNYTYFVLGTFTLHSKAETETNAYVKFSSRYIARNVLSFNNPFPLRVRRCNIVQNPELLKQEPWMEELYLWFWLIKVTILTTGGRTNNVSQNFKSLTLSNSSCNRLPQRTIK